MPPTESDRETQDPLAVVKALAEASAILVAVAFVGGWSYLASYYRAFGINPLEIEPSIPIAATLALDVMYSALPTTFRSMLFSVVVLVVAGLLIRYLKMHLSRWFLVLGLAVSLFVVSAVGLVRGQENANRDMLLESDTLPNVAFAMKEAEPAPTAVPPTKTKGQAPAVAPPSTLTLGPACVARNTYGSMECKLLLHQHNTYYFFQPLPATGIASLNLYMLNDSNVLAVHVQRGLDRNVIVSQGK